MPHLVANRVRQHAVIGVNPSRREHFRWETINAITYDIGGVIFIVGSTLFLPRLAAYADIGAWLFAIGSLLYLIVNVHDLTEVARTTGRERSHSASKALEATATLIYLIGSALFCVGSLLFLSVVDRAHWGAWCFVVGSLLFAAGASVNVIQIVQQRTLVTLQLMNLTAVSFIVGSVLFTVASIPYLWNLGNATDRTRLLTFLAWQFVVGSALFLLGGIFNHWRAYIVVRRELDAAPASLSLERDADGCSRGSSLKHPRVQ